MNLGLDMSMQLKQKLSHQMIQSLKLLQLNTLQLEQMLKTELEMNPVLETVEELEDEQQQETDAEESADEESGEAEEELDVSEDEVDWDEYLEEGFDIGDRATEEKDPNAEWHERTPVYQVTLEEHLSTQLAEKKIPPEKKLLAEFIIGCLSSDGYLRIPLKDIADFVKLSVFEVEEALRIVQQMEPSGIGARSLQECLVLQLKARGHHDSLALRIIETAWEHFEKLRIPEIARQFTVETSDVQDAVNLIKTLNPKPGYQVAPERSSLIIPDLIVEKVDGEFIVMLNDRSTPSLFINRRYASLMRGGDKVDREVKKFIREKLNNATWLIRSIEQRKSTMLKVMYAIIERQRDFFEKGPPNLHPLKLQDIADMVEMHISTISRVTNGKYAQTPFGIFELKYFFTEAMGRDGEGKDVSAERIRNRIRVLVENENARKPISDQKIADILKKENLNVARRTVAKYREQMRILPARLRQKYE